MDKIQTFGDAHAMPMGWWGPPVRVGERVYVMAVRRAPLDEALSAPRPIMQMLVSGAWEELRLVGFATGHIDGEADYMIQYACPMDTQPQAFRLTFPEATGPSQPHQALGRPDWDITFPDAAEKPGRPV